MENKRKKSRVNAKVEVLYRQITGSLISSARTKDISELGLCLPMNQFYPEGSLLEVEIRIDEFKEPIKAFAKVVRVIRKDNPKSPFEVGLNILDLPDDQKNIISEYVKSSIQE